MTESQPQVPILWVAAPGVELPPGFPLSITDVSESRELIEALMSLHESNHVFLTPSVSQLELISVLRPHLEFDVRVIRGFDNEEYSGSWALEANRYATVTVDAIMATRSPDGDRHSDEGTATRDTDPSNRLSDMDESLRSALRDVNEGGDTDEDASG